MMKPALTPDPVIVGAINALRSWLCLSSAHDLELTLSLFRTASNKFKIGALTNNFVVPGAPAPPPAPVPAPKGKVVPFELLNQSFEEALANPDTAGSPTDLLKSMFDVFVESSVEGLR